MQDKGRYVHGTEPTEQSRLSLLNDLLNAGALREMEPVRGDRVLDVGCGLAQLTRAIARATGGKTLGVERSDEQLREARRQAAEAGEAELVELRQAEIPPLPLRQDEWSSFDIAHARFVLEHVPDPLAIVREMVRAVRPGGRIVLEDDGHDTMRVSPTCAGFERLWSEYIRSYERHGNDPRVGHHLVSLLHQAGAAPVRTTWIFFGACAGDPLFKAYVENLLGVFDGARATLLESMPEALFDRDLGELKRWALHPDAALWYAVSWAEGRTRA